MFSDDKSFVIFKFSLAARFTGHVTLDYYIQLPSIIVNDIKIQGRIQGGWIGWISTPHFSVKKIIRNVTLFEIENKQEA